MALLRLICAEVETGQGRVDPTQGQDAQIERDRSHELWSAKPAQREHPHGRGLIQGESQRSRCVGSLERKSYKVLVENDHHDDRQSTKEGRWHAHSHWRKKDHVSY
jgi:hypothetical protein